MICFIFFVTFFCLSPSSFNTVIIIYWMIDKKSPKTSSVKFLLGCIRVLDYFYIGYDIHALKQKISTAYLIRFSIGYCQMLYSTQKRHFCLQILSILLNKCICNILFPLFKVVNRISSVICIYARNSFFEKFCKFCKYKSWVTLSNFPCLPSNKLVWVYLTSQW